MVTRTEIDERQIRGLDYKQSCRVATTTTLPTYSYSGTPNFTITATVNGSINSPGIDGITNLAVGDRILVKDEGSGTDTHNGIYKLTQVGDGSNPFILTRDYDGVPGELSSGAFLFVTEGTANSDTCWLLSTHDPITVDTTALTWSQFGNNFTYKRMQAPSSGAQNGVNLTFVWETFLSGSETLFINGIAVDPADYTATPSTGTIVLGGTINAPISSDQLRLTYIIAGSVTPTAPSPPYVQLRVDNFLGTGAQVAFVLPVAPVTAGVIYVAVNGSVQVTTAWTLSGSTITFGAAPASGAKIAVCYYSIKDNSVGTLSLEDFTGDGSSVDFTIAHTATTVLYVALGGLIQATTAWTMFTPTTLRFTTAPANLAKITIGYLY